MLPMSLNLPGVKGIGEAATIGVAATDGQIAVERLCRRMVSIQESSYPSGLWPVSSACDSVARSGGPTAAVESLLHQDYAEAYHHRK